jgi:hypothetical protein
MSAITITSAQRDALYKEIFVGLSGIGDVWLAACAADYDKAAELGRDYSDDLRLLLDDLGWGEVFETDVELTTPPEVLRRVLGRMRESAQADRARVDAELVKTREDHDHSQLVVETCDSLLERLGRAPAR